jgi:hypothetical protein
MQPGFVHDALFFAELCPRLCQIAAPALSNGITLLELKLNMKVSGNVRPRAFATRQKRYFFIVTLPYVFISRTNEPRNFAYRLGFYSVNMEEWKTLMYSMLALLGLGFAMALITPPKAKAAVVIGVVSP